MEKVFSGKPGLPKKKDLTILNKGYPELYPTTSIYKEVKLRKSPRKEEKKVTMINKRRRKRKKNRISKGSVLSAHILVTEISERENRENVQKEPIKLIQKIAHVWWAGREMS